MSGILDSKRGRNVSYQFYRFRYYPVGPDMIRHISADTKSNKELLEEFGHLIDQLQHLGPQRSMEPAIRPILERIEAIDQEFRSRGVDTMGRYRDAIYPIVLGLLGAESPDVKRERGRPNVEYSTPPPAPSKPPAVELGDQRYDTHQFRHFRHFRTFKGFRDPGSRRIIAFLERVAQQQYRRHPYDHAVDLVIQAYERGDADNIRDVIRNVSIRFKIDYTVLRDLVMLKLGRQASIHKSAHPVWDIRTDGAEATVVRKVPESQDRDEAPDGWLGYRAIVFDNGTEIKGSVVGRDGDFILIRTAGRVLRHHRNFVRLRNSRRS